MGCSPLAEEQTKGVAWKTKNKQEAAMNKIRWKALVLNGIMKVIQNFKELVAKNLGRLNKERGI